MNIIVLTGGTSSERNVSLSSGRAIAGGLKKNGHNFRVVDPMYGTAQPSAENIFNSHPTIGKEFPSIEELNSYSNKKVLECINSEIFDNTDIVFLALHGKFGEDGKIQSLLELRGVKYTGSGVASSAMSMDKNITKIMLNHAGVPTPAWFMVNKNDSNVKLLDEKIKESYGYPIVIKPNDEGSTIGLSIVQPDAEDVQLGSAIELAFSYTDSVMVEEYIPGRELTVAVLGEEALPVVEIKPKDGFYDYKHKYTSGMSEYFCPADITQTVSDELKQLGLLTHKTLGCKAYSRVDFRLNPEGKSYCLEINTLPGMTELSLVPKAAAAVGISFPDLLDKIIEYSLE
jgi:D-alanine-D-alanine ligase